MRRHLDIKAVISRSQARWVFPWEVKIVDFSSGANQLIDSYVCSTEKAAHRVARRELAKRQRAFDRQVGPTSVYQDGTVKDGA